MGARVRVAADDDVAGDNPTVLHHHGMLDPAASLPVEGDALFVRPLLEHPLKLGRLRILGRHEVVGHHDNF